MTSGHSKFETALSFVLCEEGTKVVHEPNGQISMKGVLQATYDNYRKIHALPWASVINIQESELKSIYFNFYWNIAGCERMAPAISLLHFDTAVNTGVDRAIRLLQRSLGVDEDGVLGIRTNEALAKANSEMLFREYAWNRIKFYVALAMRSPRFAMDLPGWVARVRRVKAYCRMLNGASA